MQIVVCEQGSPEWHAARAGAITASNFKLTRSSAKLKSGPNKGEYNEASKSYAFRLAVERISGTPLDEGFETWQMKRGHDLEPQARALHEAMAGVVVQRAGYVTTDDGLFGASADGLIAPSGGAEYKCLVSPEGLRDVLLADDIASYIDQIQGCMWITGREWWHFGLYCPALESVKLDFYWREVKRDDNYIAELEQDLVAFNRLVVGYQHALRNVRAGPEVLQLNDHAT